MNSKELKGNDLFKAIIFICICVVFIGSIFFIDNFNNDVKNVKVDKNLPIGTVVTLNGFNEPVMIYGREQLNGSNSYIYDYVACVYPEGNISADHNVFFNKEDIKKIKFLGFIEKDNSSPTKKTKVISP